MPTPPLPVSVVIVNFNGERDIVSCLLALSMQSPPVSEVIVVDNASRDRSLREIEEFRTQHPELPLRLFTNAENVGFCRGNNQGIAAASGEFILALNADVTLESDCIAALVRLMRSSPEIGIAVGKLLSGHDPKKIDSAGIVLYKTRRAVDRGQSEEDLGQYDRQEEVFGGSAAACLYRRAMLEEIKYPRSATKTPQAEHSPPDEYFDELFFAYKEDVDLSWRARLHGWRCVYTPEARGRHFRNWGSGKRGRIPRWIRCHSLKNRYLMLLKNERSGSVFHGLFHLLGYELASLGYILLREPYLLKAFWMLLRQWPEVLRKRTQTQAGVCGRIFRENLLPWFH